MERRKGKKTCDEKPSEIDKVSVPDTSSLTADPLERSYYYDDAHGYEVYHPDDESDPTEADDDKPKLEGPASAAGL